MWRYRLFFAPAGGKAEVLLHRWRTSAHAVLWALGIWNLRGERKTGKEYRFVCGREGMRVLYLKSHKSTKDMAEETGKK